MNILITGGAGFIASAIVRQLVREGRGLVVNVDKLTYAADLTRLADCAGSHHYQFVQADVCDRKIMQQVMNEYNIDAVIHAAAETHVDRSIESPEKFLRSNVAGTYHMLEVVRDYFTKLTEVKKKQFRFLQISTDEVYGDLDGLERADESSPYRPSSPYAASKAAADHFTRSWARTYGIPVLVTHSSNNYGPGQNEEKLIPKVISNALAQKSIPIFGTGSQVRDWIYVDDNARAVINVLDHGKIGESYNISTGDEVENIHLVSQLCEVLDNFVRSSEKSEVRKYHQLIEYVDDRAGHDVRYAMNAGKISQLGWKPKLSLEQGLRMTVKSFLKNFKTQ